MATNITLLDSIAIVKETGEKYPLAVSYRKILGNLFNSRISLKNATITNYDNFVNSGTALYQIGARVGTQDYKSVFDVSGPNRINQTAARLIKVDLDGQKEVNFGVSPFDVERLAVSVDEGAVTVGEGLLNTWLNSKARAVEDFLSAKLTQLAVKTAVDEGIIQLVLPTDNGTTVPTANDYRQNIWLPIADVLADLTTLITSETVGMNKEDFKLWISPRFANRLKLSTMLTGSDKSFDMAKTAVLTEIAGIELIEDPLLDKVIPKQTEGQVAYGEALDKDEAFDFSMCHAILLHKESLAFPFKVIKTREYDLFSDGSLKWLTLLSYSKDGGVALRPYSVKGFVFITPISNIIRTTDLGDIQMAGSTPTVAELETAIKQRNSNYKTGMATFGSPTATAATATGVSSKFTTGTVELTYTKAA